MKKKTNQTIIEFEYTTRLTKFMSFKKVESEQQFKRAFGRLRNRFNQIFPGQNFPIENVKISGSHSIKFQNQLSKLS